MNLNWNKTVSFGRVQVSVLGLLLLTNSAVSADDTSWLVKPAPIAQKEPGASNKGEDVSEKNSASVGEQEKSVTTEKDFAPENNVAPENLAVPDKSPTPADKSIAPVRPLAPKAKGEKPEPEGAKDALKLFSAGKYAQSAAMYQKFINQGVDNSDTHMYLGACYQQMKKYDDALKQYDWVAKNAVLISSKQKGQSAAKTLRCYRAGVCPGNCLKMSTPGWAHYPDLDKTVLWMKFSSKNGWNSWSTRHLGEVIVYENGEPVNKGKCPICHGTGKIPALK